MGHEFEASSGQIIEAAIGVHKQLGPGFLESIYEDALKVALRHRGIVYEAQKEVSISFEDEHFPEHRVKYPLPKSSHLKSPFAPWK
jgi:GxxExxY protein